MRRRGKPLTCTENLQWRLLRVTDLGSTHITAVITTVVAARKPSWVHAWLVLLLFKECLDVFCVIASILGALGHTTCLARIYQPWINLVLHEWEHTELRAWLDWRRVFAKQKTLKASIGPCALAIAGLGRSLLVSVVDSLVWDLWLITPGLWEWSAEETFHLTRFALVELAIVLGSARLYEQIWMVSLKRLRNHASTTSDRGGEELVR